MLAPSHPALSGINIGKLPCRCAFCSGTRIGWQPTQTKVEGYAEIFL
jgi:hypothetical protein